MAAPVMTAPPQAAVSGGQSTKPGSINGSVVTHTPSRFQWERALRGAPVSRNMKGFLLYLGTWMDNDGHNCRPSSRTIGDEWGVGRQRVFELLSEAESTGWVRTEKRPGRPSERLPVIPTRQSPSDGSETVTRQDTSDGLLPGNTRTRQATPDGSLTPTRQSPPDATRQSPPDPTGTEQEETGGTLPPDPLRPEHASRTRTDQHDPLTAVPDLNDTKQVTTRTRARNQTVQSPLLAIVESSIREYAIDDYQLALSVALPIPDVLDPDREAQWPALAEQLSRINQGTAS